MPPTAVTRHPEEAEVSACNRDREHRGKGRGEKAAEPENGDVHASAIAGNLHALFSTGLNETHTRVTRNLIVTDQLEQRVLAALGFHPNSKLLYVCDGVQHASVPQHVRVFGKKLPVHNAAAVIVLLKMRVRKAKEETVQLRFAEVVGQVLHRVGAQDGNIVELARILRTQAFEPVFDIQHNRGPYFHAQTELQGQLRRQRAEQPAVAAADIRIRHLRRRSRWIQRAPIELARCGGIVVTTVSKRI